MPSIVGVQMVLAGIETGGVGNDVGAALCDMCEGLERGLRDVIERGQRRGAA